MSKSAYDASREHADDLLQDLAYEFDGRQITYEKLFGYDPDEELYERLLSMIIKSFSYYDRSVLPE